MYVCMYSRMSKGRIFRQQLAKRILPEYNRDKRSNYLGGNIFCYFGTRQIDDTKTLGRRA